MSANETAAPKQGGFHYAWLVMFGFGMLMCGTIGAFTVLGSLFFYPVSEAIGCDLSVFTLSVTIQMLAMAVGMPVVGNLLSKVKLPVMLTVATLVEVAAVFSMSFFTEVWQWYVASVLIGLGLSATSTVSITPTLGNWFMKKTGFAMGLVWSIQSVFCAVASPIFSNIIADMGWRTAYMILAVVGAVLSLPFTIFVIRYRPEDKGMLPYGYEEGAAAPGADVPEGAETGVSIKVAMKSLPFFICIGVVMLCQLTSCMNTFFASYAEAVGLGAVVGGLMVTAASVFDIALNPMVGATSDKFGATKSMVFWTGVTILSLVLLYVGKTSPILSYLGAGINDTMYVVCGVGYATYAMTLFGMKDFEKIFSRITMVGYLVASLGLPLMMFIGETTGAFENAFLFCIVLDVIVIVLALAGEKAGKKLPWTDTDDKPVANPNA